MLKAHAKSKPHNGLFKDNWTHKGAQKSGRNKMNSFWASKQMVYF